MFTLTPQKVVIGSSLNLTLLWSMARRSALELGIAYKLLFSMLKLMKNAHIHKHLSKIGFPTLTPQKVVIESSLNLTLLCSMARRSALELKFA